MGHVLSFLDILPLQRRESGQGLIGPIQQKSALGPYAYEEHMPDRLLRQLESDNHIVGHYRTDSTGNLISTDTGRDVELNRTVEVLAKLCDHDPSVKRTYLCHPAVLRISKTKREGNLCGYRNIQMLTSYICGAQAEGHERFPGGVPSVLQIQNLIEDAWARGINSEGQAETGGITGTRKHIGTPEAQALFRGLGISCRANAYHDSSPDAGGPQAWESLLQSIEQYFSSAPTTTRALLEGRKTKVRRTDLPPIYLQRPHHSMTIVGFEVRTNGSRNLLVFDPAFSPTPDMRKATRSTVDGTTFHISHPRALLRRYRRGKWQLQRHHDFETLTLTGSLSAAAAAAAVVGDFKGLMERGKSFDGERWSERSLSVDATTGPIWNGRLPPARFR